MAAVGDLRAVLKNSGRLVSRMESEVPAKFGSLLTEATRALGSAQQVLARDAPLQTDLRRALADLGRAARSLRVFTDYLERYPESLLRGKRRDAEMTPAFRFVALLLLSQAGCATSTAEHFFVLTDVERAASPPSGSYAGSLVVDPVSLPELVDRPQFVIRGERRPGRDPRAATLGRTAPVGRRPAHGRSARASSGNDLGVLQRRRAGAARPSRGRRHQKARLCPGSRRDRRGPVERGGRGWHEQDRILAGASTEPGWRLRRAGGSARPGPGRCEPGHR